MSKRNKKDNHCSHNVATIRVVWSCVTCEVTEAVCASCRKLIETKKSF